MLAREVETNKQLYDGVLQRLKEIGVAAEARTSNIYLMGKAEPPLDPSYPDSTGHSILGLLLGLAAGVGLAFLLEQLDNTIKSPEEAERYLHLPTLASGAGLCATDERTGATAICSLVKSAKGELPGRQPAGRRPRAVLDHHPLSLVRRSLPIFAFVAAVVPGGAGRLISCS